MKTIVTKEAGPTVPLGQLSSRLRRKYMLFLKLQLSIRVVFLGPIEN